MRKTKYTSKAILNLFYRHADVEIDGKKAISKEEFLSVINDIVSQKLWEISTKYRQRLPIDEVIDLTSEFLQIPREMIVKKSQERECVESRMLISLYCKENRHTYPAIAHKLGKTHGAIMNNRSKALELKETNPEFARLYTELKYILDSKKSGGINLLQKNQKNES